MKTKFIAFCGAKQSGKSTSGSILKALTNIPTEEIAIAGHLKEVCAKVFNLEYNNFIDNTLKERQLDAPIALMRDNIEEIYKQFNVQNVVYDTDIRPYINKLFYTPRQILQYVGTELLHPKDPLIHVKIAMVKKDPNKLALITDLRFGAEFQEFAKLNEDFFPVYVKNNAAETAALADSHASEREWQTFKHLCLELDNNGTLRELKQRINSDIVDKIE